MAPLYLLINVHVFDLMGYAQYSYCDVSRVRSSAAEGELFSDCVQICILAPETVRKVLHKHSATPLALSSTTTTADILATKPILPREGQWQMW